MKNSSLPLPLFAALAAAFCLAAAPPAPAQTNIAAADAAPAPLSAADAGMENTYRVVSGDVLDITVADEKDLTAEYTVSPKGGINLYLLNELPAANRTTFQIQTNITELLRADYIINPIVRVSVKKFRKRIVTVIGEVQKPTTIEFEGDHVMTVTEAISTAGGFTKYVKKSKTIYIIRGNKKIEFDYAKYLDNPAAYPVSDVLQDKDKVDVPASLF